MASNEEDGEPKALEIRRTGSEMLQVEREERPGWFEGIVKLSRFSFLNRKKTEAAKAQREYIEEETKTAGAWTEHERAMARARDIATLIDTDQANRYVTARESLRRLAKQGDLDAEAALLKDEVEIKKKKLEIEKLGLERRLAALKDPPRPPDAVTETAKEIRLKILAGLSRIYTKVEIAKQAALLKDEYIQSAGGGRITDGVRLMLENIDDAAQALMHEVDR